MADGASAQNSKKYHVIWIHRLPPVSNAKYTIKKRPHPNPGALFVTVVFYLDCGFKFLIF